MEEKHSWKGLIDLSFKTSASRSVAPVLYVAFILLFLFQMVMSILGAISQLEASLVNGIILIVVAVIVAALEVLIIRALLEAMLKLFEIAENTKKQ
jgi:quinol-cytochrome oxidoreductase complex cytochrome b subunit